MLQGFRLYSLVCKIHVYKKIKNGKHLDSDSSYDALSYGIGPNLFLGISWWTLLLLHRLPGQLVVPLRSMDRLLSQILHVGTYCISVNISFLIFAILPFHSCYILVYQFAVIHTIILFIF